MKGSELFRNYTDKRDYSGSETDEYAQLLMTIWSNIFDKVYPLLEEAERKGKKLAIKVLPEEELFMQDELTVSDIIFV